MAGKGFTIRGPARDGALVNDEGDLTRFVADSLGRCSGEKGHEAAARVAAARRALWRVLEVYAPRALGRHLRARAAEGQDYSNRKAVGDLRRAVADWLDPSVPECASCGRPVTERHRHRARRPKAPAVARGQRAVGKARQEAWRREVAAWEAERRRQVGEHLQARRAWALRDRARDAGRPLQLSVLAVGRPFPGEGLPDLLAKDDRYGVEVDRDGRVLRAVVREVLGQADFLGVAAGRVVPVPRTTPNGVRVRPAVTASPVVAAAWWRFCRALDEAFAENGRLYLKTQGRYAPAGGVTRADLLQESAAGAIRGLYDFDATRAKVSTYVVNWCRQGLSRAFGERDEVATPAWLRDLRGNLERAGLQDVRAARRDVEACEAVPPASAPPAKTDDSATRAAKFFADIIRHEAAKDLAADVLAHAPTAPRSTWAPDDVVPPIAQEAWSAGRLTLTDLWLERLAVVEAGLRADLLALAGPVARQEAAARALAEALGIRVRRPPPPKGKAKAPRRRKGDPPAPRKPKVKPARRPGEPPGVTGTAVLQALRFEEFRRHSLMTAADEADGGGGDDGGGRGGAYDGRGRQPVDDLTPEVALLAAEEAGDRADDLSDLFDALEALRIADPRACEVVRRHHGLDAAGDGETFAEVAEAGLRCDGPAAAPVTRDDVRRLHAAGMRHLQAAVGDDVLGLLPASNEEDVDDDEFDYLAPRIARIRSSGPWKALRPIAVTTTAAAVTPRADAGRDEDWFAGRASFEAISW